MPIIREHLSSTGLSERARHLIMSSWRPATKKQYQVYLTKWKQYCGQREIDPLLPSVLDTIDFLAELFDSGIGYSSMNTARCALSAYITLPNGTTLGTHPLVKRLMRGIFTLKPALPRYSSTWDVNIVFGYLRSQGPAAKLSLKQLTLKLVMLLALLTAQRGQTLHALDIESMSLTKTVCTFAIRTPLKTTKPGKHLQNISLKAYVPDRRLCPVGYMTEYVQRTKQVRETTNLLVSWVKPHKRVSRNTISRWIKTVLKQSGIDTNIYKPHTTRSASTSAAKLADIPIDTILKSAGWANAQTFQTYYNKPIDGQDFACSLLDTCK